MATHPRPEPHGAERAPGGVDVDARAAGLRVSVHADGTGTVTPLPGARVRADDLRAELEHLAGRGVRQVTTSAIAAYDTGPWEAAGFVPATHLVLLRAEIGLPPRRRWREPVRVRTGRAPDWGDVERVDTAAFAPQPGLGLGALRDAMAVTPASRLRVVGAPVVGFAIAGRDARCGYLQRLAVAPADAGHGIGSALVVDVLRWLRRHGAREALVNTEPENGRALALYERHGFVRQHEGLVVLGWRP